jgi:class 3 adenylate cyclase
MEPTSNDQQPSEAAGGFGWLLVDRAFAFVDLSGFTEFAQCHDEATAAQVLRLMRDVIRSVATRYGVRVDKWLGDGAMLVGVEPSQLVQAVVEVHWALREPSPLKLRSGITAGQAMVLEGDDYVGRCVNLAAKLCDGGQPGECLAPGDLAPHCPAGVQAVPIALPATGVLSVLPSLVRLRLDETPAGLRRREMSGQLGQDALLRYPGLREPPQRRRTEV